MEDKAWALSILLNSFERKFLSSKDLKEMITERVGNTLFKYSYDYVGDLAETISLLWESNENIRSNINLNQFMTLISECNDKEKLKKKLNLIWIVHLKIKDIVF